MAVGGGKHASAALAGFQNGETRLVYARRRDNPTELFYLEDGTASDLRSWAKEHLECFMPVCENRRLTTVARRRRRDGFTHMSGSGGHSPESMFHQQLKVLVEQWARDKYPDVEVRQEQWTRSRARRADVMITSADGSRQVAVEVQYSPLDPSEWQARHDSYASQGIHDVWLFRPSAPHLRASAVDGYVKLGLLHQTMAAAGVPLLWINPVEGLIGTVMVDGALRRCHPEGCWHGQQEDHVWLPPSGTETQARFAVDQFADCRLIRGKFVTPTLRALGDSSQRWDAILTRDHDRLAKLAAEADLQRLKKAEEVARERKAGEEEDQRLHEWLSASRAKLEARWLSSELHRATVERHGGAIPAFLATESTSDLGVLDLPVAWHVLLYTRLVQGRSRGRPFRLHDCEQILRRQGIALHDSAKRRTRALDGFIRILADAGLVHQGRGTPWIFVDADIEAIAARRARRAALAAANSVRAEEVAQGMAAEREAERARRLDALLAKVSARDDASPRSLSRDGEAASTVTPAVIAHGVRGPQRLYCLRCGGPLDPCLKSGYHADPYCSR